jgi:hypothetical protein
MKKSKINLESWTGYRATFCTYCIRLDMGDRLVKLVIGCEASF